MGGRTCWLFKTEPEAYSIDDLERDGAEHWEGIRNYQARNLIRDEIRKGDLVLFYHSSTNPAGVVGSARVCKAAYPDFTAWDPTSKYFDPKSDPENPRWFMVDVEFVERFPKLVTLEAMKADPALEGLMVAKRGVRLSIQPVSPEHFSRVRELGGIGKGAAARKRTRK